jgi:hypothetical protein
MPPHKILDSASMDNDFVESVPAKSLSPRSHRTVAFASSPEVREIMHINDLKDLTDINDLWFNEDEIRAIRFSCQKIIHCLEHGKSFGDEECERGLEGRTYEKKRLRRENRVIAIHAVLREQALQRREGIIDGELLADAYYGSSSESQAAALSKAIQDSIAVEEDYWFAF